MTKTKSGWELTLQMKPDIYQYRFIVDGHWMEDPHNPHKTKNEFEKSFLDQNNFVGSLVKPISLDDVKQIVQSLTQ